MGRLGKSLRRSAILAAVAATCAACAAGATAAPLLWAVNSAEDSVSTIEGTTGRIVGSPIATGDSPDSIAISPDARRAYVADADGESVTVIDTATRLPVASIPLDSDAEQVAVSADGSVALVTTESGRVFVIGTETNSIVGSIPAGPKASAIAASPITSELAYVGIAPDEVQMLDLRTGGLVDEPVEVGGFPRAIAVSADAKAVFVAAGEELDVIEAGAVVDKVPVGSEATNLALSPDGTRVYVTSGPAKTVTVIAVASGEVLGAPIPLSAEPDEIALSANGQIAYVATGGGITPIDLTTRLPTTPIGRPGAGVSKLVVAPDQPPTAAFEPPPAAVGVPVPVTFSAAPSTDPDSSIATYRWNFSDATSAAGPTATRTYPSPGAYLTMLSLADDEGCGLIQVFTGRTAYCNGGGGASVAHPVTVTSGAAATPHPPPPFICSTALRIGRIVHNRRNGTARLQVRVPADGSLYLFGRKVHAVTRRSVDPGSTFLTLHARVEVNKRLKQTHHTGVRYRVTFFPAAGCSPTTVHRSLALLRAPQKKKR